MGMHVAEVQKDVTDDNPQTPVADTFSIKCTLRHRFRVLLLTLFVTYHRSLFHY